MTSCYVHTVKNFRRTYTKCSCNRRPYHSCNSQNHDKRSAMTNILCFPFLCSFRCRYLMSYLRTGIESGHGSNENTKPQKTLLEIPSAKCYAGKLMGFVLSVRRSWLSTRGAHAGASSLCATQRHFMRYHTVSSTRRFVTEFGIQCLHHKAANTSNSLILGIQHYRNSSPRYNAK
jgi:hypothetical protein